MSNIIERSTKTVITPLGKQQVVMLEYITGREAEQIAIASQGADKDYAASLGARDNAIEIIIKSIDGVTEGITDLVKDMPLEDYSFLNDEVTALVDIKKK